MSALDRRFATALRIMRESAHRGERDTAQARLEEFARKAGISLEAAIAQHEAPNARRPAANIFAGFDDWMEERAPGYQKKRATERADKISAWRKRKAALIQERGGIEAVTAPCGREIKLLAAVKPWRKPSSRPHQRWTASLDGWRDWDWEKAPAHVLEAIRTAYPLPATFHAAKDELDYWRVRNQELEDVLTDQWPFPADQALDLVADIRFSMVRRHVEQDLRLICMGDVMARFAMAQASEVDEHHMIAAVYRDLRDLMFGPDERQSGEVGVRHSAGTGGDG